MKSKQIELEAFPVTWLSGGEKCVFFAFSTPLFIVIVALAFWCERMANLQHHSSWEKINGIALSTETGTIKCGICWLFEKRARDWGCLETLTGCWSVIAAFWTLTLASHQHLPLLLLLRLQRQLQIKPTMEAPHSCSGIGPINWLESVIWVMPDLSIPTGTHFSDYKCVLCVTCIMNFAMTFLAWSLDLHIHHPPSSL